MNRDPTLTSQTKANNLITKLLKFKSITEEQGKTFKNYNSIPPRLYGNPKIHKEGFPSRPIVSLVQGPLSSISKYLAEVLKKSYIIDNEYYIRDSFHFSSIINGLKIPENYVIVSFDVVNLYGNMSKNSIIKAISNKWENIKNFTKGLTKKFFIEIIEFVLGNNYFKYRDQFYVQTFGCAMDSKLSQILA